ncbi:hypothetical protein DSO57_1037386 [Entomophthora muscae]|uniref:Uncharacterized protein n=1 Tax=Entomophthora muscae TaxID=34485 RepID=A0ACC2SNE0_9FUNG|nr:hypothetical protein DSO57_1037386 [Entomophthora muscae]
MLFLWGIMSVFGELGLQRNTHVLADTRTQLNLSYFGFAEIYPLELNGCFWADKPHLTKREGYDLIPSPTFKGRYQTCVEDQSLECLVIKKNYFYIHKEEPVSDPVFCSYDELCYVENEIPVVRSLRVLSSGQVEDYEWERIFIRFLGIHASFYSLPWIVHRVDQASIFVLWFKPISWVVEGRYSKTINNLTESSPFRAEFPLGTQNRLNGIFGVTDLCSSTPVPRLSDIKGEEYVKFLAVASFFCPAIKNDASFP